MSLPWRTPDSPQEETTCCGCLHFPIFAKAHRNNNGIISLPVQPSPAPQLQSVDHVTEDVRNALTTAIATKSPSAPSLQIPIISEVTSTNHRNEDTDGGDDVDNGHPVTSQVPAIVPTVLSTLCGNKDAPNGKAGDRDDDFVISQVASVIHFTPVAPFINRGNKYMHSVRAGDRPDSDDESVILQETTSGDRDDRGQGSSINILSGASDFEIHNANIIGISGDATIIQFGNEQFTETQRNLIGDYISTFTALTDISDNVKKHILTQLITNLPRAEGVYSDYRTMKKSGPCFKGTRVALLREMADWVTGSDEIKMYILSGLAGIGKSTVSYTIASRAANLNLLGASFFFSRDEADRNNAKKLFTTVAYQLCVYNERFSKAIGDVLLTEDGSAATTKDPLEQLRLLIIDPIRSIVQSHARPILIVIDALDECCEDDIRCVFTGLSRLVQELPPFKVILTTRPKPYINYLFKNRDGHEFFHLHDIEDKIVDSDIRLYLEHHLSLEKVREHFPRRQWYASNKEIDFLVRSAGRLFIIASTTVRYILDKFAADPAARMQKLLNACAQDRTPFKDLGDFYTIILRNVVPENCDDEDIVSRYQKVVGTIISIQRPLSISALSRLIETDTEEIYAVLDNLQPVILLANGYLPRVYHRSFPDYLTDKARCKDPHLLIDSKIRHTQIATRCFGTMNKHLRYNILGLHTPARFMSNEDALKTDRITDQQVQDNIPEQLSYACVYWAAHFDSSDIEDTDLMNGLGKFMDEHTLHWSEVLSLIGKLDSAHLAIRIVLRRLKLTSSSLYQFLSEVLRFISKFYKIIHQSALHIYYSALPFFTTNSLLYCRYIIEAEESIFRIQGGPENWDPLVAMLNHEEVADVIKFSLDSTMLVSWSEKYVCKNRRSKGMLRIWDAVTGTPISSVRGHRFAITNDFSTVISCKANTITYYNMDGSARGPTLIAPSNIQALALSSESSRLVAALSDGTGLLWDSGDDKLIDSFRGLQGNPAGYWGRYRLWLQFSPTGARLAHSSANNKIKLRDGITGRFIADLPCGGPSHEFEFSRDGSHIASLSRDYGFRLWNSENGGLINIVNFQYAFAISGNGSLIATANDYAKVTLWGKNRGSLAQIQVLKPGYANSMALSQDNMLAVGTNLGGIKLYNTETDSFVSTLPSGNSPITLEFSPDCTRLASLHFFIDFKVPLWDIQNINASSSLLRETIAVTVVALSRDCLRLACGFKDGTVELWNTSPTMERIASQKPHLSPVAVIRFGPDNRRFVSATFVGDIKLWNGGDGSFILDLDTGKGGLRTVALSKNMICEGGDGYVTLWDLDTRSLFHGFKPSSPAVTTVSISDESDLAAVALGGPPHTVDLFDVVNRVSIAQFRTPFAIQHLEFQPNNSHLLGRSFDDKFISLNIIDNRATELEGPMMRECLIQSPNTPLWHGVPVWICGRANEQRYVSALFSQNRSPVTVLWIPTHIPVGSCAEGSSMIALGCEDGRIILLRLPTT